MKKEVLEEAVSLANRINRLDQLVKLLENSTQVFLSEKFDPSGGYMYGSFPLDKELKDKIIRALDNNVEQLKKRVFIEVRIEVESELFKLTAEACADHFVEDYVTCVNNVQRCIEKPFEALQNEINKKNQKIINYM